MVYFLPDWSRTTSIRTLTADSVLEGAGPYLRCTSRQLESASAMDIRSVDSQYGNAQHGYMRAFDAKHGKLGVAFCRAIQIDRIRLRGRDVRWRLAVENIIC